MDMSPTDLKPAHISEAEWTLRQQLAHCYHLVDHFGWTETIFNHISARIPGSEHYLVNPFGLNYDEVTPANLLKVDLDGHKVEPSPYDANPAGFALHSAIHGAREDIHCVIHTHTTEVSAVAMKRAGFGHDDFYGAQLTGRVGYHAFEGITLFEDEKPRMLASLGDKHILVLRNHGVAVGEMDIPRTFFLLWTVQRAAEIQCAAGAIPGDNVALAPAVSQRCADLTAQLIREDDFAEKFFAAMVRRLRPRG
ncbi:ribulose-5-phosphate 4-epimerase/fuculose-1-phosphate aldolase [Sphaerotilus hippei]|uniref:Ribulose-5-phosphate 4-epimerase/fuculose-1-phosphate aldolase n=1 Tax=Sphaerotilus hippei TaxID=744406 RepID=A0A318H6L2_9BURK|nr:class II aldolase/adducin family protein [Sphaerotilus hippei]PXW99361.1 ribulose-5-phosphate 4-epimerase/fuculose-1-phosphate aldolase [Sphaerotilus hippei]